MKRRSFIAAAGTAGVASLSGCVDVGSVLNPGESSRPTPSPSDLIRDLTLKRAPRDIVDEYTVAVSDNVLDYGGDEQEYSLSDGLQVRLRQQSDVDTRTEDTHLYDINTNPEFTGSQDNTIWLSESGMNRMQVVEGTLMEIKPFAASLNLNNRESARERNELLEQRVFANNILFMTTYGGQIFQNTHLQAFRGSTEIESAGAWTLSAYGDTRTDAIEKWYLPPEVYNSKSFFELQKFNIPMDHVVFFTGHETNAKEILIGGLASDDIKVDIEEALISKFQNDESVDPAVSIDRVYSGEGAATDPQHIANEVSDKDSNAVVISQSPAVRNRYWKQVSDSIIEAYSELDN